jgi:ABC-type transport system involved in cytochrome c biogenesis permease component
LVVVAVVVAEVAAEVLVDIVLLSLEIPLVVEQVQKVYYQYQLHQVLIQ